MIWYTITEELKHWKSANESVFAIIYAATLSVILCGIWFDSILLPILLRIGKFEGDIVPWDRHTNCSIINCLEIPWNILYLARQRFGEGVRNVHEIMTKCNLISFTSIYAHRSGSTEIGLKYNSQCCKKQHDLTHFRVHLSHTLWLHRTAPTMDSN